MTDKSTIQIKTEILDSEAYKIYHRLNVLTFSFRVFEGNYRQLNQLLTAASQPEAFFEWSGVGKRREFEIILIEVARCLTNYLTSALALVNHTRNSIEKYYSKSTFITDYRRRIKTDFNDGLHQFIQELRNYNSHHVLLLPSTNAQLDLADNGEHQMKITIMLEKSRLERWGNWNTSSKNYLAKLDANIDLLKLTDEYFVLVSNFHIWMHSELDNHHKDELEWLESMRLELARRDSSFHEF